MRLANGYGSITKLKGHRRNPFMVRITTGKTKEGKYIREVLGYYPSHAKAVDALSEFNREPYDIANQKLTFTDIYNKWKESKEYDALSDNTKRQSKSKYLICKLVLTIMTVDILQDDI